MPLFAFLLVGASVSCLSDVVRGTAKMQQNEACSWPFPRVRQKHEAQLTWGVRRRLGERRPGQLGPAQPTRLPAGRGCQHPGSAQAPEGDSPQRGRVSLGLPTERRLQQVNRKHWHQAGLILKMALGVERVRGSQKEHCQLVKSDLVELRSEASNVQRFPWWKF